MPKYKITQTFLIEGEDHDVKELLDALLRQAVTLGASSPGGTTEVIDPESG